MKVSLFTELSRPAATESWKLVQLNCTGVHRFTEYVLYESNNRRLVYESYTYPWILNSLMWRLWNSFLRCVLWL